MPRGTELAASLRRGLGIPRQRQWFGSKLRSDISDDCTMKPFALIITAFLSITACSTQREIQIGVPFDGAKARAQLVPGTNQVGGRVMAALSNGTLVSCAGQVVSLVPATAYAGEWARQFYELDTGKYGSLNSAYRMDGRESEIRFVGAQSFYANTRTTRCDEDGNFSFANVADGEFFVVAKTRWLGRDHDYYDFMYGINDAQEEDGSVMQKVRVSGGSGIDLQWVPPSPVLLGGEGLR